MLRWLARLIFPPKRPPVSFLEWRHAVLLLQDVHARAAAQGIDTDTTELHLERGHWLKKRAEFAAKGYDVAGLDLPELPASVERARAELDQARALAEVDKLLT